jgi:tetratricopeptide (TPR) repeat protein
MFGWLKDQSRCPVTPDVQAWLEGRAAWIAREFGSERLRDELVLPNDDFFPGEYNGNEEDVRRLFEQVCEYMGVDFSRVDLQFYRVGDRRALTPLDGWAWTVGLYQDKDGRAVVQIEESQFDEPLSLVATFAHELAHVLLLGEHRLKEDEEDGERVTDLVAVFLGFGVFVANSASHSNVFLGLVEGRASSRLGYLNDAELAYALAIIAWLHYQGKPEWANLVRPNVREPMMDGIRWLSEVDEDTQLPRGRRFDVLGVKADAFPLARHPVLAHFARESAEEGENRGNLDHFSLGLWAVTDGRFDEAVRELSISIEGVPDDAEAYQQRAQAYLGLNHVEEALSDAERAMTIAPDDVASRCIRGKALVRAGHYDAAVADFDLVIAESDAHGSEGEQLAEAYFLRGLIRALGEDLSAAIRDFTRSIITVPYRPEVYEARAAAYERQGKTKKAQIDREEAEYRQSKPPQ